MTLSIPRHLQAAGIQDNAVRYAWDDWAQNPEAETPDEDLAARLETVSQRAVLAFMCGTAEWIVHRFARLCDSPTPAAFLEAAWAMTVDIHYGEPGGAIAWEKYTINTS